VVNFKGELGVWVAKFCKILMGTAQLFIIGIAMSRRQHCPVFVHSLPACPSGTAPSRLSSCTLPTPSRAR